MKYTFLVSLFLVWSTAANAANPSEKISALIDRHLQADWAAKGITPAAKADDAEFYRRVYLDITGVIPSVPDTRAFLASVDKDKRAKLVDNLLAGENHTKHFAAMLRKEMVNPSETNFRVNNRLMDFEIWLQEQIRDNAPYDVMVKSLLTTKVNLGQRGEVELDDDRGNRKPLDKAAFIYYGALDGKPEQIAASVSRLFLGVKLECAQCHDHPFANYSRDQFWEFTAFFGEFSALSPVSPSFRGPLPPQFDINRIAVPNTEKVLEAKHFDGSAVEWINILTPRQELALWIDGPGQVYFAKNAVNRAWARFFGLGILDPLDEPGDKNPPSHPELLKELAQAFVYAKFNSKTLYRGIVLSKAYQLSSRLSHPSQSDPRRFARMNLKGIDGGAVYDSLTKATGIVRDDVDQSYSGRFNNNGERFMFASRFNNLGKTTETPTTILQALTLMNGNFMNVVVPEKGTILAAVADAPFMSTNDKIETLFLATLTRFPTDDERERFASLVDRGGDADHANKALADIFWVLLNSTEFLFNH